MEFNDKSSNKILVSWKDYESMEKFWSTLKWRKNFVPLPESPSYSMSQEKHISVYVLLKIFHFSFTDM